MKPSPQTPDAAAPSTLVLTRGDVAGLMTVADYIAAAEDAFAASADGRAKVPAPLHIPADHGGFHAKGASLHARDGRLYVAIKMNANFPANKQEFGLPTIQGAILLFDAQDGRLLTITDSIEVTLQRTAAATALAARYLARRDSSIATICGCGDQALAQLNYLAQELPIARVHAFDADPDSATRFAREMTAKLHLDVRAARDMAEATNVSDVIVTSTTAREPFLRIGDVRPGTFVAAVGADSHDKSELFPELMARSKIVVDSIEQCRVMGDLHHAIAAGALSVDQVHATLGELVIDKKRGRANDHEITIFDSTGTAAQDVAAAISIYQRGKSRQLGLVCQLGVSPPTALSEHALMTSTAHPRELRR